MNYSQSISNENFKKSYNLTCFLSVTWQFLLKMGKENDIDYIFKIDFWNQFIKYIICCDKKFQTLEATYTLEFIHGPSRSTYSNE